MIVEELGETRNEAGGLRKVQARKALKRRARNERARKAQKARQQDPLVATGLPLMFSSWRTGRVMPACPASGQQVGNIFPTLAGATGLFPPHSLPCGRFSTDSPRRVQTRRYDSSERARTSCPMSLSFTPPGLHAPLPHLIDINHVNGTVGSAYHDALLICGDYD